MASNTYINIKRTRFASKGKTEKISTSGTHAESTTAAPKSSFMEVWTDATNGVYVSIGSAPDVSTNANKTYVPPKWLMTFDVVAGDKISAVEA